MKKVRGETNPPATREGPKKPSRLGLLAIGLLTLALASVATPAVALPGTVQTEEGAASSVSVTDLEEPWMPDPASQAAIDAAEPGTVVIFSRSEGEQPRLVKNSTSVDATSVSSSTASAPPPAALGCLMSINTPQNVGVGGQLRHRAELTCTDRVQYLRGLICPEFFNGDWVRQNDVCADTVRLLSVGFAVERDVFCARGTTYRTWGELRVDFLNQTATDSNVGAIQNCVF